VIVITVPPELELTFGTRTIGSEAVSVIPAGASQI